MPAETDKVQNFGPFPVGQKMIYKIFNLFPFVKYKHLKFISENLALLGPYVEIALYGGIAKNNNFPNLLKLPPEKPKLCSDMGLYGTE